VAVSLLGIGRIQGARILALLFNSARAQKTLTKYDPRAIQGSKGYRSDIDGLRAVAVLSVVMFHAGFPGAPGGFVGVDVFFVISGYLITGILISDLNKSEYSVVVFYERRIRRIVPALFLVMVFCSLAAYLIYTPLHLKDFSKSLVATTLFTSNVLFWEQSGYFDLAADVKPLLHTWSLSVEEQFYVVYPVLLWALWKGARVWLVPILWLLAISSFALSVAGVHYAPSAAFYMGPTRAWELLLGALVAVRAIRLPAVVWVREVAASGGLILIAFAVCWITQSDPFPGFSAIYPCAGAALIVLAGCDNYKCFCTQVLSVRPLALIGLFSYSLYLWHWPLLVFARYWNLDSLNSAQTMIVLSISFGAAWLSFRFIETPFRRSPPTFSRRMVFHSAGLASCLVLAVGGFGFVSEGVPSRMPTSVIEMADYSTSRLKVLDACSSDGSTPVRLPEESCVLGPSEQPTIAVWGDSHTLGLVPAILSTSEPLGKSIRFIEYHGCPPMVLVHTQVGCFEHNQKVISFLLSRTDIKKVVLAARWSVYVYGFPNDLGPDENGRVPPLLTNSSGSMLDIRTKEDLFSLAIHDTVLALASAGKEVVLVYPVPEVAYDVPLILARYRWQGHDPSLFTNPADYFFKRNDFVMKVLDGLGDSPTIQRVYPHERLCANGKCLVYEDGRPLCADSNHLSLPGAHLLNSLFLPLFRDSVSMR
jgi:peptidoglycan/LPS O-acetylase OafA/YrhL